MLKMNMRKEGIAYITKSSIFQSPECDATFFQTGLGGDNSNLYNIFHLSTFYSIFQPNFTS